jgi:hypothetical protein
LKPSDVKPPLAQFQATKAQKDDVLKLLKTLNDALGDNALLESHIEEAFEVWWPKLESQLKTLPNEDSKTKTHRPDRELLEEVLALVRNQSRPDPIPLQTAVAEPKVGKEFPYDLTTGPIVAELQRVSNLHGLVLSKVTRIAPEKADSKRYQITLTSGQALAFEVPDGLSNDGIAKYLVSQADDVLKRFEATTKSKSPG